MNRTYDIPLGATASRIVAAAIAVLILAAAVLLYSRIAGIYHVKQAEVLIAQRKQVDARLETAAGNPAEAARLRTVRAGLFEQIEKRLTRALDADPVNGLACWLLSNEYLGQALAIADLAKGTREQLLQRRAELLDKAAELAHRGERFFNSVGCYKQLASIYLRQNRPERAEPYLQIVSRIKPDDIEAVERLGLLKLTLRKWDELEALCDHILQKHPYSANAYYYKAFMAQERLKENQGDPETNRNELYINARQAYLMYRQKTGQIFFDASVLEQMVSNLKLAETR
ncbi:MAG: hypothetical protein N3D11_09165 [Candidatus Sumerlaeia bacterium]|nr:hypothetical protein [Candidatus Sumerlaeia bacterium]